MKLVVGLGNPGPKYETTRHNAGWLALDRLIDDWRARGPVTKGQGELWQADVGGEKVLLIKPQTFMNLSGRCVGPIFNFHKCAPGDLVVLYDELDLPPLALRFKTGGGAGGHNGIKSLDEALGSANNAYHRVRIGIGHPAKLSLRVQPVDYVLQNFSDDELAGLDPLFDRVRQGVELVLQGKAGEAMTRFNRSPGEPSA